MKKRLVLTTVFAMFFGCVVSFADVSPRGDRGPEKPKTVKVDNKRDNKKPAVKPAAKPNNKPVVHKPEPKPNHKPVAHKPAPKPNHKPVAHRPHKPDHKHVCHVKHHHKPECHKPHHEVVFNPLDPFGIHALTTAAIVAAIID